LWQESEPSRIRFWAQVECPNGSETGEELFPKSPTVGVEKYRSGSRKKGNELFLKDARPRKPLWKCCTQLHTLAK